MDRPRIRYGGLWGGAEAAWVDVGHDVDTETGLPSILAPHPRLPLEGYLNKTIAGRLEMSPRTTEHHRAHIMEKMAARSLSHLIRMMLDCGR